MFSLFHNESRNHVRLDKKEDFAVPGIHDIYARKILIYAGKKDVKYTTISSKWVLIILWNNNHTVHVNERNQNKNKNQV